LPALRSSSVVSLAILAVLSQQTDSIDSDPGGKRFIASLKRDVAPSLGFLAVP
jgi:hypothetical protein